MRSPILWQNADRTVTLLDVPTSIAAAQGSIDESAKRYLISSPPIGTPYPTNEPKSAAARSKLEGNTVDVELHVEYHEILRQALEAARSEHDGEWCLPRLVIKQPPGAAQKRPLEDSEDTSESENRMPARSSGLPDGLLTDASRRRFIRRSRPGSHKAVRVMLNGTESPVIKDPGISYWNPKDTPDLFSFTDTIAAKGWQFHIPPKATFYLGDCANSRSFHSAIHRQAECNSTRTSFDFILLDPPWPNRSVKRTHKTAGSTYATLPTLLDVRELVLDTKLDVLMAENCLVGLWITNKPAIRDLVLGENGIFACWGVEIVEEWLWLKTTVSGEPVTPLDALWRKPYEVLLLARKQSSSNVDVTAETTSAKPDVQRRIIISVPDLHSRKPCLKQLVEPLMPDQNDYRALEMFARHLIAGWWSWGDECIKFNWEGYWRETKHPAADG